MMMIHWLYIEKQSIALSWRYYKSFNNIAIIIIIIRFLIYTSLNFLLFSTHFYNSNNSISYAHIVINTCHKHMPQYPWWWCAWCFPIIIAISLLLDFRFFSIFLSFPMLLLIYMDKMMMMLNSKNSHNTVYGASLVKSCLFQALKWKKIKIK